MVLNAPRKLALSEVERPAAKEGQVLVRVTNSGVCGTDLKIYDGGISVRHPLIMGHEMIGVVAEGSADGVKPGDRVIIDPSLYCGRCYSCRAGKTNLCPNGALLGRDANGGFAEYVAAPANHVFRLPDSIPDRSAVLIQVMTTCLHAQRLINMFPGEAVVVTGLGVTGQIHVQLAKARGAYPVIGVSRSAWKRQLAEKLGADLTFASGAEAAKGVLQATDGRGADVVIDVTGKDTVMSEGIQMARLGATMLLFGITTAKTCDLPFYQLYYKEMNLVNARAAKGEDYPASISLVASGKVDLTPLVTHVVPLAELESAVTMLDSDADERMKIILENTV